MDLFSPEFELVLANVAKHVSLLPNEARIFLELLEPRSLRPKEHLLVQGKVCKYSIFVTKGCLKGYTLDDNALEHVLSFAPPGWWIADMYSLFSQKPGTLYIRATEPTEVLLLTKEKQEHLYRTVPKFERFFRILTENSLVTHQQRILDNIGHTAEERYRHFEQRYPMLVHCLPQKDIASYIGVTPEFFSKMKKAILRQ
jgi:CRP-like cAMP-binding protein